MIELDDPPIGRRRFVFVPRRPGANFGGLVEYEKAPPRPRVHLTGGNREPFRSMADGKVYDDWATYRRELKAIGQDRDGGLEEVGNEAAIPWAQSIGDDDPTLRDDLIETAREMQISIEGRFDDRDQSVA